MTASKLEMNSILLELENAIQSSYMSEFEDFIRDDVTLLPYTILLINYYRLSLSRTTHSPPRYLTARTKRK